MMGAESCCVQPEIKGHQLIPGIPDDGELFVGLELFGKLSANCLGRIVDIVSPVVDLVGRPATMNRIVPVSGSVSIAIE